jgi:hypothetical protein
MVQLTYGLDFKPLVNVADRGWAVQNALKTNFDSATTCRVTDYAHIKRTLANGEWKSKLKNAENLAVIMNDITDLHLCTGPKKFLRRAELTMVKWKGLGEEQFAADFWDSFVVGTAKPQGAADHLDTPEPLAWYIGALLVHVGFPGVLPGTGGPSTQDHEAYNKVFTHFFGRTNASLEYGFTTGFQQMLTMTIEHYCSAPQCSVPVVPAHLYVLAYRAFCPPTGGISVNNHRKCRITLPAFPSQNSPEQQSSKEVDCYVCIRSHFLHTMNVDARLCENAIAGGHPVDLHSCLLP